MRRVMMGLLGAALLACGGGDSAMNEGGAGTDAGAMPESGGLEITHITEGSGPSPKTTDVVKVHYHGTFPDGAVFDSSVDRGEPASFPLNRVIKCWTEGLQMMKVGGTAKFECPAKIAYGLRGAPPNIPPNATLHFEVQLLAVY